MLIGLVGKPSSGKSTFFKAATLADVAIASFPFTTIKPNHGIGYVKVDCVDKDFNVKCQPQHGFCIQGKRFVPVELLDVAGLVPGASEGKGLGNQFLDDLRQADVFVHIVDVSGTTDSEGKPTEKHNPLKDVLFLEEEIDKWYYGILMKAWKNFSKKLDTDPDINFSSAVVKQFSALKVNEEQVKKVILDLNFGERPGRWSNEQLFKFASELRKDSKKTIIAANKIDLKDSFENYKKIKEKFPHLKIIPCSSDFELALREASKAGLIEYVPGEKDFKITGNLNEKQKQALEEIKKFLGMFETGTGIQEILNYSVFELLNHIPVFPVGTAKLQDSEGRVLPDCFLLPKGSTALDLAYSLHTDLGKNFVKAIDLKTKKILGKDYKLKNRDVIEIVTR